MITVHANGNRVQYGIKHFILDTIDDLTGLNKELLTPGSTIFIINTSKYFMLNGKRIGLKLIHMVWAILPIMVLEITMEDLAEITTDPIQMMN